ncbi:nuclear receptor 2c2-associated [Moesziomyces antarcticus]|uniref:Nuclear receptor 2c2-associated n=2 Tax=Pseudozyma antarctica TaxID=84753 RepID=A0A081CM67_PSEA2|nr:nuclear receptor 2c2-associated [Moesziomyces antarcticus]GAK67763.1 nuclear receptor 2c2-associated [Moesziomyces antarcticus]SPO49004.1 related to TR4 orphan receptor associated protein TRA16 [Moesziomyces antarcticus]
MSAAPTLTAPAAPAGVSLANLLEGGVKVKVSSGSSKEAKNVLDGCAETCWTSDHLAPNSDPTTARSFLSFKLGHPIALSQLHSLSLTFAGGFSPMSLSIATSEQDGKTWTPLTNQMLFPNDTNAKQYFDLTHLVHDGGNPDNTAAWIRLEFIGSTDDYGRLTVYQTEIFALPPSSHQSA